MAHIVPISLAPIYDIASQYTRAGYENIIDKYSYAASERNR